MIGAAVAAALVMLWVVIGPGPKFEEEFVAIGFAVAIGFCGLIAAILNPRPLLAPIVFPAIWMVGHVVMWIQIARQYDYSFWESGPFLFGLKCAFGILVFLAVVNLISAAIHSAAKRWNRRTNRE